MADDPKKVGVYDTDGGTRTGAATGGMNWWIIALIVLVILVALYFLL